MTVSVWRAIMSFKYLYIWFLKVQIKFADAGIRRIKDLDQFEEDFLANLLRMVKRYSQEVRWEFLGKSYPNYILVSLYVFYAFVDQLNITMIFVVNTLFSRNYSNDFFFRLMKITAEKELTRIQNYK